MAIISGAIDKRLRVFLWVHFWRCVTSARTHAGSRGAREQIR